MTWFVVDELDNAIRYSILFLNPLLLSKKYELAIKSAILKQTNLG